VPRALHHAVVVVAVAAAAAALNATKNLHNLLSPSTPLADTVESVVVATQCLSFPHLDPCLAGTLI
jgi:hypothetical protein